MPPAARTVRADPWRHRSQATGAWLALVCALSAVEATIDPARHYGTSFLIQAAAAIETSDASTLNVSEAHEQARMLNNLTATVGAHKLESAGEGAVLASAGSGVSDASNGTMDAGVVAASARSAAKTVDGGMLESARADDPGAQFSHNSHLADSVAPAPNHGDPNQFHGSEGGTQDNENSHAEPNHVKTHSKGYLALAFLFGTLVIGSVLQVVQVRFLSCVPYTCLLFITGFILAVIHENRTYRNWTEWATWYISVDLWYQINPHLIFYIFLPALIFAETMQLNVIVAKTVYKQVFVLACPGVLVSMFLIACFSFYAFPYDWSWPTCLAFGSILAATDPVAVLAVFSHIGVSPRLTMLISGESMINHTTAIVCFALMIKLMLGSEVTVGGAISYFLHMTISASLIGASISVGCLIVISFCAESNYKSDSMIQIVITICCGFLCFFIGETELLTSGVMAVVAAGGIFSYVAWPRFVDREAMHVVWHTIEFISNTLIFTIAGLLWGSRVISRNQYLHVSDMAWLVFLYAAITVIRTGMVALFYHLLNKVGPHITREEAIVMAWSGLPGAVGLVLAIIVDLEPSVNQTIGSQVMFHVGGMVMMTILINATTVGSLLRYFKLTATPRIEEQTIAHFEKLTQDRVREQMKSIMENESDERFSGANLEVVKALVPSLAAECGTRPKHAVAPGPGEVDVDAETKLQMYRQTFMRAVQHKYWENIEGGLLPRRSRVARTLIFSTESAMLNAHFALGDWQMLVENICENQRLPMLNRLANKWPLTLIPPLQHVFPGPATIMMWQVYACLSFLEAHEVAQVDVPKYFDILESVAGQGVQMRVIAESRASCDKARALLESLPREGVRAGKSRMLAGKLLQAKLHKVDELKDKGVLNESGAAWIAQPIHTAQRELASITWHDITGQREFGTASKILQPSSTGAAPRDPMAPACGRQRAGSNVSDSDDDHSGPNWRSGTSDHREKSRDPGGTHAAAGEERERSKSRQPKRR